MRIVHFKLEWDGGRNPTIESVDAFVVPAPGTELDAHLPLEHGGVYLSEDRPSDATYMALHASVSAPMTDGVLTVYVEHKTVARFRPTHQQPAQFCMYFAPNARVLLTLELGDGTMRRIVIGRTPPGIFKAEIVSAPRI